MSEEMGNVSNIIKNALNSCVPNEWGQVWEMFLYTHKGVGYVVSENSLKYGFGVLSGLTPTFILLETIDDFNRTLSNFFVWLSPGQDNDNWCLMVGSKISYHHITRDTLFDLVTVMNSAQELLLKNLYEKFSEMGGRTFWEYNNEEFESAGLLLMTKLG